MKALAFLITEALFVAYSANAHAQTILTVGGAYTGKQVWDADTVKIEGDIAIAGRLDIRPGTYVEFQGYYEITADSILAMGSIGDSITFTINDTTGFTQYNLQQGGWKKLQAVYYMEFNYCRFMYGKYYGRILRIAKRCYDYPVRINNSLISNIYSYSFTGTHGSPGDCFMDEAIFRNSLFINNQFYELSYANSLIDSCRFIGNSCKISGSIIDSYFGNNKKIKFFGCEYISLGIRYCIIENNDTLQIKCSSLGYLNISSSIFTGNFNTVFNSSSATGISIANNTFFNNHIAQDAKALFNLSGNPIAFYNNILYGNNKQSPQAKLINFNSALFKYNLIEGGHDEIEYNGIPGEGNIDVDPLFVDTLHNDLHLSAQSPCINSGFYNIHFYPDTHDLDGNPRIYPNRLDLGPYEFQGTPENRPPIIELFSTPKILPGVSSPLTVRFFDPDSGDICSVSDVLSETPEIKADIIASDSASVTVNMTADSDWQGTGHIQIKVTDKHDHITSYEFPVIVSKVVCGELSSNTVWGGDTVKVECDVTVRKGVTLTIQPETTITFDKNCRLIVKGLLMAAGNDSSRITFTSSDTSGFYRDGYEGWGGISNYIRGQYHSGMAIFRYCDFQYSTANSLYSSTIYWRTTGNYGDSLIVTNCNFYNNHSQSDGGAIFIHSHAIIHNTTFFNNKTEGSGGAIYLDYHSIDISNCIFVNNSAEYGGAIFNNSIPVINNCLFVGNSAKYGGAIASYFNLKLINITLSENYAEISGGGIDCQEGSIINCILWNNKAGSFGNEIRQNYGSLFVNNSIIKDGINGISCSDILPTNTIYSVNPYFKNSSAYDFHLSDSSFAINTGLSDTSGLYLPATDLDGNLRVADLYIDIGAYEYHANTFTLWKHPQVLKACSGDEGQLTTNASGGVTGYQWQKNGTDLPGATGRILMFPTLDTSQAGNYSCKVISTDRISYTDTVPVIVDIPAVITKYTESFVTCEQKDILLLLKTGGGRVNEFSWLKNGFALESEDESELVFPSLKLSDEGIYQGIAKNTCGSDTTDPIIVQVNPLPRPDLGNDTSFCAPASIVLAPDETYPGHTWNTGSQDDSIVVYISGIYWLAVTDANGCSNTDSIWVTINPMPYVYLGNDTSIHTTDTLYLNAGAGFESYLWNTGDDAQMLLVHKKQPGEYEYWVLVTNTIGCSSGDTVIVTVEQATPVTDKLWSADLKIYPNPTLGILNLVSEINLANVRIVIYDVKGRLVLQKKIEQLKAGETYALNLSVLQPGVYQLQAGEKMVRIIKR